MAEPFTRANYAGATDEEVKAQQMAQAAPSMETEVAEATPLEAQVEAASIAPAYAAESQHEEEEQEIAWTRANYSGSPGDLAERNAQMLAGRKAMNMAAVSENAQTTTPLAAWGQRRPTLSCDTNIVANEDDDDATLEEENPPPYENYEALPGSSPARQQHPEEHEQQQQQQRSTDTSKISASIWNMAKALCPSQLELLFAFVTRVMTSLLSKRRATVPA